MQESAAGGAVWMLISLLPVPQVTLKKHIANCSQGAALVAAILTGEADLLGSALCEWLHLLFPTAFPPLLLAFQQSARRSFFVADHIPDC